MSRIEGVTDDKAGLLARAAFWYCKRRVGEVITPLRILAHHSRVLRGYGAMEMKLEKCRRLPPALKELANLKVAQLVGCPF